MKCFISYRREDSRSVTERIYDQLVARFGENTIFKDANSISVGSDFRHRLQEALSSCDVLLAIIGDHWLDITNQHGRRRLDDKEDFVRIEIESALERGIRIIPVLINNTRMPKVGELPQSMQKLAFIQGAVIRHDPDFHRDTDNLIRLLVEVIIDGLIRQTEEMPSSDSFGSLQKSDLFTLFSKTIEKDDLNVAALMKRGQMAYISARQCGKGYKQAVDDFRNIIGIDSKLADPHFGLGTIYFDIATFDLVKRHRYRIHEKGKFRVNKKTSLPETKPPLVEFSPDDQTRSILQAALDEFERGNQLQQYYSKQREGIIVGFATTDLDSRIHSIRGILGYEPLKEYDETFMSIFAMFHIRLGEEGAEGLYETVDYVPDGTIPMPRRRIVSIIVILGIVTLHILAFRKWSGQWLFTIPVAAFDAIFLILFFLGIFRRLRRKSA